MDANNIPPSTYISVAVELLLPFFEGKTSKVMEWMDTENYLIGMVKPIDMILSGRGAKLISYIGAMLDENVREK